MPATSGELGVLANHVPVIEQLKPGVIDIVEEVGITKQFFGKFCIILQFQIKLKALIVSVSGGFAIVQPGSLLSINAVEAYPAEDFSAEVKIICRTCEGVVKRLKS